MEALFLNQVLVHQLAFFQNVIETFLKYAFKEVGSDTFKADGIMVTHPDGDHIQGVLKLFEKFPPNQDAKPGKAKFEFKGPLLLTKYFENNTIYKSIINAIEAAKFKRKGISSGDQIDGFEEHFTFFYPYNRYPGVLYTYQPPPVLPKFFTMLASARYSPITLDPNLSSTILVIKNPNDVAGSPLISLNGDAIGHLIIASLNDKNPKIFKVPHHGSVSNSIALKHYVPKKLKLVEKLLASLALLQIGLNNDFNFTDKQIEFISRRKFEVVFRKVERRIKARLIKFPQLKFVTSIKMMANFFLTELQIEKFNPVNLLHQLENFKSMIFTSLKDPSLSSDELYSRNMSNTLEQFAINHYNKIKFFTRKHESDPRQPFSYLFNKMLETDKIFSGPVAFHLNRAFYSKINAHTFFISSGSRYDHPSWEVVNAIIAAAYDQHKKKSSYKCRLLLTSGNNIKGDKLAELRMSYLSNDDWTQYCSLQYFGPNTASVELDPNEDNPLQTLPGADEWSPALTDAQQNNLLSSYNNTYGAKELKRLRSVEDGKYEIKSIGANPLWLSIELDATSGNTLALSPNITKIQVAVENVQYEKSKYVAEFKLTSVKDAHLSVNVFCLLGTHTKSSNIKTYILYRVLDEKRHYLQHSVSDSITSTPTEEEATHFKFTAVPAVPLLPVAFALSLNADSQHSLLYEGSTSRLLPYAAVERDTSLLSLQQFLDLVQYQNSTILCQDILDIVVSRQFPIQFLADPSSSTVSKFITDTFAFIVNGSSIFTVKHSEVVSAHVKLTMPMKQLSLYSHSITDVAYIVTDPKTVDQKVDLQLQATVDKFPVTWTCHLKSNTNVRSFQKYLVSLGISKNPSSFKMFDAVIFLHQSESSASVYLSSLSRKMLSNVLE